MARTVGIGIQDFGKIIENGYFYVDKTPFIKEWWESGDEVTLITRPRRFGKTSVLNMLGAYDCKAYDVKALFENAKIRESASYMVHLNQYNVINLCLNEIPLDRSRYEDYIAQFNDAIINDVREAYPALKDRKFKTAILLVGINHNTDKKEHQCVIEEIH